MDKEIIANIKSLGIDMIHEAKSGHPGIVLGAASILYTIYAKHMHVYEDDPTWMNRDRFVLSAGHGSALLYANLYMAGLGYTIDDLKNFRKIHSVTTGHPEYGISPFVEATTGPLGQGIAMAVGMALGEKILEEKYTLENGESLFNYKVYVLCGDGDLMEGISTEAASFAGAHNLNNLIVLYDSNQTSLDGKTSHTFHEDILKKFEACGWNTLEVDGTDTEQIDHAIEKAKMSFKPTLIECHTKIGEGSLLEGNHLSHGKPLTEEDINQLKEKLGVPLEPFYVNKEAKNHFKTVLKKRTLSKYKEFKEKEEILKNEDPEKALQLQKFIAGKVVSVNDDWFDLKEEVESTRVSNGKIMNDLARHVDCFLGGSADLSSSAMTYLKEMGDVSPLKYDGRNIWFGVREHAMGAILNGLALTNFRVFGSTFFVFSDYLKPALRLSALMNLPVSYVFTHDSIEVGEDGPTHEPIEQLTSLRSTPNLKVFRPCNKREIIEAWKCTFHERGPSAFILSRGSGKIPIESNGGEVEKGAYILKREKEHLDGTILASGTEVGRALQIAMNLYEEKHIDLRVVSMPCLELFKRQDKKYQEEVLGKKHLFVFEAANHGGFESFASSFTMLNINTFGKSGSKEDVLRELSFDDKKIQQKIEEVYEVKYEK